MPTEPRDLAGTKNISPLKLLSGVRFGTLRPEQWVWRVLGEFVVIRHAGSSPVFALMVEGAMTASC
jgi:hypothetical protein